MQLYDLKKLKINLVLFKSLADSNWTNSAYYGVTGYPTYNGREVVLATSVLNAFQMFMNAKTSLNFDHAIGLFK